MAGGDEHKQDLDNEVGSIRLKFFKIADLFGGKTQNIEFPETNPLSKQPSILILSGRNGSGKTTILKMISQAVRLDFDTFRLIPFSVAELGLTNGDVLRIEKTSNSDFNLKVTFRDANALLVKDKRKAEYNEQQTKDIERFRALAIPVLRQISIEYLDVHRSSALQIKEMYNNALYSETIDPRLINRSNSITLADRVREFMKEAQVNYRRFFSAEELELLPRILDRFKTSQTKPDRMLLKSRIEAVQAQFPKMKRYGLQTDDADLHTLSALLVDERYSNDLPSLTLLDAYVETQENKHKARELIARRLNEFETILDEFLTGKSVRIDTQEGLTIKTSSGLSLKETDLSSGEYHFLFMMVSALLCKSVGSIIAIDEPELSLHVVWQRKVVKALALCAAGASPLFLFATHSAAISAEHSDKIYSLSSVE